MSYDWRRILDGPRGRELCLELALEVERRTWPGDSPSTVGPLADASFHAAVGQPGVVFYNSAEADPHEEPAEPVATSVDDLASALAGLPVEPADPRELSVHLADAVSSAKYWQEPDRRDELLADARIVELLTPWAGLLGEMRETS